MARNILLFLVLSFTVSAFAATKGELLELLIGSPCEACRVFIHQMAIDVCADMNAPASCIGENFDRLSFVYCADECKEFQSCD